MPAVLAYLLTAAGVSAAVASTIVAFAIVAAPYALLLGGLAYSSMKARQAKAQARDAYNAAQVDRMVNITSSTAPRDLVLGRVRKGGTFAYKASTGTYQKDLYLAIALAGHEVDAIEAYYLNDELVTVDGSGNVTTAPYATAATLSGTIYISSGFTATIPATYVVGSVTVTALGTVSTSGADVLRDREISFSQAGTLITASEASATVHYQYTTSGSNVKIIQHLGGAGQTVDADLLAAFPSDWVSANIAQGVAYVVAKLTYSEASFPSGAPNLTVVLRGAKVYDPRTTNTVWSENPALMMRHIYAHSKFGKATVTAAEDARFIAAANACDTSTVYTVGGVAQAAQALFKASLVLPYGAAPKDAFDDLAQAMGGSWAFAGGEIYLKAGVYTAPVMTLGDEDLAVIQRNGASESQKPIAIAVHKERAQKYNTVKVKIWDAGQDYKQSELTPLIASALVTRDGVELTQEVTYPAIGYAPQALHVAGIMMRDARDPLTVELPFKLRAYPLELFDTVSLTLSRYGWSAKTFMILGRVWNADGTLSLTLKETSAAITQMDAGFSAQGFAANTNLPKPWQIGSVGALTITSGTSELIKQADGTVQSRMRVSWSAVTDISVQQVGQIEVQFRAAGSSGAWTSLIVPGDETSVATSDVQDYATYTVRARCKTKLAVSDWNAQVAHQVVGKTAPPSNVLGLSYVTNETGVIFSFTPCADADYARTEFRVGATWATATIIEDPWLRPASGTYTVLAKHFDTSGIESATAASLSVTYTQTPISNALVDAASIGAVKTDLTNAPGGILNSNVTAVGIGAVKTDASNAPGTILNSSITVTAGAISGIGTGDGTIVSNSSITISGGAIGGIGTGAGTVVDNSLVTATGIGAVKTDASNAPGTILNSSITISAGAISGIGTGSGTVVDNSIITATSNGRGAALNLDPNCKDQTAWSGWSGQGAGTVTAITDGVTGNSVLRATGSTRSVSSVLIPCDSSKTYRITALVRQNGDGALYLRTVQYLPTETLPSQGIELTHGVEWVFPPTGAWTRYSATFTPTSGRAFFSPHILLAWGGTAGYMEAQDIRIEEVLPSTMVTPDGGWLNSNITIGSNGVLSGAGGGTVTATGISAVATDLSNAPSAILNSAITLGTLGAGSFASLSQITSGNVGTYIAAAAIDTARIQNAAITNALIGNLAVGTAQVQDAAVTNAKIGNLAVDTLQIAGNAVTIPSGTFTAATTSQTISVVAQELLLASVSYTSTGAPVTIIGQADSYNNINASSTGYATLVVKRSGTSLISRSYTQLRQAAAESALLNVVVIDTPPAGSVTYDLYLSHYRTGSGVQTTYALNRVITATELKK